MIDMDGFLAEDRTLVDRLAQQTDGAARMALIVESIETGEAAIGETANAAEAANAMLAVASSCLLAASEAPNPKTAATHARDAAGWSGRVVQLSGAEPGPVLFFVPRAATIVVAAMGYVSETKRLVWMAHLETWTKKVADAIAAQPALERDGMTQLVVGSVLVDGIDAVSPDDETTVRMRAAVILRRAERLLSEAGDVELTAEARRVLKTAQP